MNELGMVAILVWIEQLTCQPRCSWRSFGFSWVARSGGHWTRVRRGISVRVTCRLGRTYTGRRRGDPVAVVRVPLCRRPVARLAVAARAGSFHRDAIARAERVAPDLARQLALVGGAGIEEQTRAATRLAAEEAPRGNPGSLGRAEKARIVTKNLDGPAEPESAAMPARAAAALDQRILRHQQRVLGLQRLDRKVRGIRHVHLDGI